MNSFSPTLKLSGIVLLIGLVILGMLGIVLITFVIVRVTSPSPTQAGILFPPTAQVVNATPVPATAFPATQTSAPPTSEPSPYPSATAPEAPTETPDGQAIQPADNFLSEYFSSINARDYTTTWAKLSDKYKAANNPDGYKPYVNFWDSVNKVDVLTPDVIYQKKDSAKISARLNFTYKNGIKGSQVVTFELIPDDQGTSWLIDKSY